MRQSTIQRKTSETDIQLKMDMDQFERGSINTGSPFLDHMLDLWQVHSGISLNLICKGDSQIDMHHSTEDIAICLGQALLECLGDKAGIERYGFYYVTMDEALARACIDFSGRYGFSFNVPLTNEKVGNMDVELFSHFFQSIAENSKMNIHIDLIRGRDHHHCLEAVFKAFARAVAMAISPSHRLKGIPSSKGSL